MERLIDKKKIEEYGVIYDDLFFSLRYAFASIPENDGLDYIKNTTFNERLIFYALYGKQGVTLKELAGLSGIEYRNLSQYVNTLVAKGYVDKKSVTTRNGIKSSISLTPVGVKILRENNEAVCEGIRKRFSKAMSEEEFDELMDLSKRLTAILSKVIPEDTAAVKRNEARLKTELKLKAE